MSFPASGATWVDHLLDATSYHHRADLALQPLSDDGIVPPVRAEPGFVLRAERLDHVVEAFGYRLDEPAGRRMVPELLAAAGIHGPTVGLLQREGVVEVGAGTVGLEDVSVVRPGQSFAFVMDTRLCDAVFSLARGVDLLVIEATFLDRDRDLAHAFGHLTALQAATVAAECGVRSLVLTHFSQRYQDPAEFWAEARTVFDGELTVAEDLDRVQVPPRVH